MLSIMSNSKLSWQEGGEGLELRDQLNSPIILKNFERHELTRKLSKYMYMYVVLKLPFF